MDTIINERVFRDMLQCLKLAQYYYTVRLTMDGVGPVERQTVVDDLSLITAAIKAAEGK